MSEVDASRAVGSRDLARRLGIDESRVRRLAASGKLPGRKVGHDWLFELDLVGDRVSNVRSPGRPFSQANALGLLYLASGAEAGWLAPAVRSRLQRRLGTSISKLLPRLRSRAERRVYRAPDALLEKLRSDPEFILSGVSASDHYGMRIVAPGLIEGYADPALIDRVAYRYGLERVGERDANLIVHVAPRGFLPRSRFMPRAVVAADLADHSDARTRRVGEDLLARRGR